MICYDLEYFTFLGGAHLFRRILPTVVYVRISDETILSIPIGIYLSIRVISEFRVNKILRK